MLDRLSGNAAAKLPIFLIFFHGDVLKLYRMYYTVYSIYIYILVYIVYSIV